MAKIDPRCYWIEAKDGVEYKVLEVWFYDGVEAAGGVTFDVVVTNSTGRKVLYHQKVTVAYPDGSDDFWTRSDGVRYTMSGDSSFDPQRNEQGPYSVRCGDAVVIGLGLPLKQHVGYLIVFGRK